MTKHPQRSLMLSPDEWARWEALAIALNAVPSQGPQTQTPTWRTVAKWIGQGKLEVTPAVCNDPDWMPPPVYACTCGRGAEVHPTQHNESCEVYAPF
jgi:hypothetical protein